MIWSLKNTAANSFYFPLSGKDFYITIVLFCRPAAIPGGDFSFLGR
jgi:hypothetical protein